MLELLFKELLGRCILERRDEHQSEVSKQCTVQKLSENEGKTMQKLTRTCSSDSLQYGHCELLSECSPSLAQLISIDYMHQLAFPYMPNYVASHLLAVRESGHTCKEQFLSRKQFLPSRTCITSKARAFDELSSLVRIKLQQSFPTATNHAVCMWIKVSFHWPSNLQPVSLSLMTISESSASMASSPG